MSALFNFHSFLTVVLLGICTCTYVKMHFPALLEQRTGQQVSLFYCYWVLCKPTRWYILSLDGLRSHKDTLVLSTPLPLGLPFSLPPLMPSLILFCNEKTGPWR
ncbi:hypothetical protein KY285_027803 [Solanum tuberosum]|nr:hypothetical protein KY285_027803 [Solanum tuberosum]